MRLCLVEVFGFPGKADMSSVNDVEKLTREDYHPAHVELMERPHLAALEVNV
jgi:hypothetical protein